MRSLIRRSRRQQAQIMRHYTSASSDDGVGGGGEESGSSDEFRSKSDDDSSEDVMSNVKSGTRPRNVQAAGAGRKKPSSLAVAQKRKLQESALPTMKQEPSVTELRLPRPVDAPYWPLPWHGRLGYACLNTVLRARREPVFCSRTCRLDTVRKAEAVSSGGGGLKLLQSLGKRNASDLSQLIEWNEAHGIKFMRISSEMFPFAAHQEMGYTLEFASPELRAAGDLAMQYGHRLTMHPGQFTQIASPRPEVFVNAERDLEHHAELLTRLGLQGQMDRDAVMIVHMGGTYGDKAATLQRFRTNYGKLSEHVRARLVLENDDVSWSVRDLLPVCQELGIPLVLDWHHHNIVHEADMREGTLDLLPYLEAVAETWKSRNIRQKQHYSESREPEHPSAMRRRAHSARVRNFPPCVSDMDLMIEAKDKEQAVFDLMRHAGIPTPNLITIQQRAADSNVDCEGNYWPESEGWRLEKAKRVSKKEVKVSKRDSVSDEDSGKEIDGSARRVRRRNKY